MRKLFIPLLLFSALEANEKNGFFIEAGFETGLLEGTQTQEKRHTTTKNTYATYSYLPTDSVLKRAANLFTDAKSISQLTFSSLSPVKVLYVGGKLTIENFLPYNLSNVKLSFKDAQGNTIDLGVIETIPKHSKIVLPGEAFDSLKEAFDKIGPYTFFFPKIEATSTSISDANTQRVFETLNNIKTNLIMKYSNKNPSNFNTCPYNNNGNTKNDCWQNFTPQTAEEFTNLMLNMIAVLDSQSWGDAILNAPFEFTNKGGEGECDTSKENECVNPGTNGVVNSQNKGYVLNKQDIVNKFRNKADLDVIVLKDSGVVGLGSDITPSNNDDGKHYGQLGVVASALVPKKLFGNDLKTINLEDLRTILHEFSHTKGYTHNGNMTYQRVPVMKNGQVEKDNNGKPKDSDGLPYNVCSLYGGSNQPAFPSNYPNSIYHNCADVPAGFLGVTAAVWQQLINQNALPINYANLSAQTNYNLNASLNTQDLANSMLSTIQKPLSPLALPTTIFQALHKVLEALF
ncbi:hypothetical protein [Helicobacter pylori]|uniref:hypothetical protein n=1 Tax=Helicobacter pylori TaxID=210 RepID=UPI00026B1A4F|nr:putative outer membrane protein [Helicobacter pylori Hp H-3]